MGTEAASSLVPQRSGENPRGNQCASVYSKSPGITPIVNPVSRRAWHASSGFGAWRHPCVATREIAASQSVLPLSTISTSQYSVMRLNDVLPCIAFKEIESVWSASVILKASMRPLKPENAGNEHCQHTEAKCSQVFTVPATLSFDPRELSRATEQQQSEKHGGSSGWGSFAAGSLERSN